MTSDTPPASPKPTPPPTSPASAMPAASVSSVSHLGAMVAWGVWSAVAVAVIAAGYFGFRWYTLRVSHSITDNAFVESHIVNVAPEMVSGRIVGFFVEENDRVEQGQVLAQIESIQYRDLLDQARGKLALAEAELKRQETGLEKLRMEVPLQIDVARQTLAAAKTDEQRAQDALKIITDEVGGTIDEARAAIEVAQSNVTLAKLEFDRYTQLAAQNAAPERRAQEVTRAHEVAQAEQRLAEVRLTKAEAARTRIEVAKRDIEIAKTQATKASNALNLAETGHDQIRELELMVEVQRERVKEAQLAVDAAQHQLEFTQVRAPFPGVVVKRYRSLGDTVSAGVPILSMYNPELLFVTANFEETRLRGVAPGNAVELHIDAFDRPFRGRVVWISKSTGAQFALMPRNVVAGEFTKVVQRVPVRIWIEPNDRWPLLRAGLSVRAIISHGEGDAAWAEQTAKEMARTESQFNQP